MWSPAMLTAALGAPEPDHIGQLRPVEGIQVFVLRTDRHGDLERRSIRFETKSESWSPTFVRGSMYGIVCRRRATHVKSVPLPNGPHFPRVERARRRLGSRPEAAAKS